MAQLNGATKAGLQMVRWNLVQARRQRGRSSFVPNGEYRVTLIIDGKEVAKQTLSVKRDPTLSSDAISEAEYEAVQRELEADETDEGGVDNNGATDKTRDQDYQK